MEKGKAQNNAAGAMTARERLVAVSGWSVAMSKFDMKANSLCLSKEQAPEVSRPGPNWDRTTPRSGTHSKLTDWPAGGTKKKVLTPETKRTGQRMLPK